MRLCDIMKHNLPQYVPLVERLALQVRYLVISSDVPFTTLCDEQCSTQLMQVHSKAAHWRQTCWGRSIACCCPGRTADTGKGTRAVMLSVSVHFLVSGRFVNHWCLIWALEGTHCCIASCRHRQRG